MLMAQPVPACKELVLDAGPLLSLSPLRGLAETYVTVPQVLDELKDKRAREHFERLGLSAGVKIEIMNPDPLSLAHVIQFAKKTGDYSVLSHADLCVLALTYALDLKGKAEKLRQDVAAKEKAEAAALAGKFSHEDPRNAELSENLNDISLQKELPETQTAIIDDTVDSTENDNLDAEDSEDCDSDGARVDSTAEVLEALENDPDASDHEPLDITVERIINTESPPRTHSPSALAQDLNTLPSNPSESVSQPIPVFEDPMEPDDGEGEWITPANVAIYKSRALDLLPASADSSDPFTVVSRKQGNQKKIFNHASASADAKVKEQIYAACMTADFAMQNVLLQMGLNLVGVEGKRIEKVKSWVLRCHACFKICKDSTKKFCPSCGNPTLLRTSVTTSAPTEDGSTPTMQIHLKKNFTYRTRGTIYSIPAPKPGSSKKGNGEGLILREDQVEYMRAKKKNDGKREREDQRLVQGVLEAGKKGTLSAGVVGSWMDPDWVPGIISVGIGGKGRPSPGAQSALGADGMPIVGYGRKNPNEKRRRK